MRKWRRFYAILVLCTCLCSVKPVYADTALIAQGVTKMVLSVLEIPMSVVEDSKEIIFPVGVLTGVVKGTVRTVAGILEGGFNVAAGAAPYAKYLIFFI